MRGVKTNLGLGLLSAAAIGFEISLTRLFAVQQFYHFAFMAVSLAVMAGAGGGLLLLLRPRHPPLWMLACAFSASVGLAYLTIETLPFDSYSIAWDRRQVEVLFLYFVMAGLPFLMAGWSVAACLVQAGPHAHRPYAANLVGSAIGCLSLPALLSVVGAEGSVLAEFGLGFLAAAAFCPRRPLRAALAIATLSAGYLAFRPPAWIRLTLSPYKPLSSALQAADARHTLSRWTVQSRADVVESLSLHTFPGLSLKAGSDLPEEAALFLDGEGPLPIVRIQTESPQAERLAARMPNSLAFHLRPAARVLELLPGAGFDAQLALASGASDVTLAIDDPVVHNILVGPYADFTAGLLSRPDVHVLDQPARRVLRSGDQQFDVVLYALSDPFRPITSGAFSLTESYALTVEAFDDAIDRLDEDGLLVITRWLGTPPVEAPRAWATLLAAMRQEGIGGLGAHLVAFRSMRTATFIASRTPFTQAELAATREFMQANAFDPIYLPGLRPDELNRHNVLQQDTYYSLFLSLLDDPSETIARSAFDLRPPTDDRPYFFHFFRWQQTQEILSTLGQTWQPFGGSGYLVLLALLIVMLSLAIPLAVAPALLPRSGLSPSAHLPARMTYFACLGAGYLFVELAFLQRMTLLLDRSAIALPTVLFILLGASGLGSLLSLRLELRIALAGLCVVLGVAVMTLPAAIVRGLPWGLVPRLGLATLLIAPSGLLMGVPFAAGLRRLERTSPGAIPWAWSVNGSASGVAGVLATMLLVSYGATVTLLIGVSLYLGALLTSCRLGTEPWLPPATGSCRYGLFRPKRQMR
ncbi:MAG: hypothetical protein M1389_13070 [Chloroflexi bacterium]|nr:hypothetical protein [Chloroflexota bacterium]